MTADITITVGVELGAYIKRGTTAAGATNYLNLLEFLALQELQYLERQILTLQV